MANEEQLSILKQGVEVWNKWRDENPNITIDLNFANLDHANLRRFNLSKANLFRSSLIGSDLFSADLDGANLRNANLTGAELSIAKLNKAVLYQANLSEVSLVNAALNSAILEETHLAGANLRKAKFENASFIKTHFEKVNLCDADLLETNFREIDLFETDLTNAMVGLTIFSFVQFIGVIGLDTVRHIRPSTIGSNTFQLSKGHIHNTFLRGCGLSDWEIEMVKLYNPDLNNDERNKILYKAYDLQVSQAIQISPLFISYSHEDTQFVDKIENQLNAKGVRFWRDIHDMKAGRIEKQIDTAISQNRTVLLVLSQNSIKSDWVEHEVRTARELEKDMGRDVLCPIALDDSWKSSPWPKRVMEQIMEYNILDFSAWEDDVKFEGMFRKLIDGLELFYKG